MRHSRILVAFAIVSFSVAQIACGPVSDVPAYDPAEAAAQIRESSQVWASVAVTGDPSPLEELFADDFIGTDSDGRLYTKRDFIDNVRSNPNTFLSNNVNEVSVRFFGNVAVAQGNETFTRRDGVSARFVWTDVYVLRDDNWEIVAAQDLVAPENVDPNAAPFSSVRSPQDSP